METGSDTLLIFLNERFFKWSKRKLIEERILLTKLLLIVSGSAAQM